MGFDDWLEDYEKGRGVDVSSLILSRQSQSQNESEKQRQWEDARAKAHAESVERDRRLRLNEMSEVEFTNQLKKDLEDILQSHRLAKI